MTSAWIQTYSGLAFDLANPKPEQVSAEDVAHALGNLCRFAGHCSVRYTVADHCINLARYFLEYGTPEEAFDALIHDAHEAYLGDMTSPLKRLVPAYVALERRAEAEVRRALGSDSPWSSSAVKTGDTRILLTEVALFLGPPPRPWGINETPLDCRITIHAQPAAEWAALYGKLRPR